MADIYRPDYTRDNRFRTYLNQYSATSGTVPSASLLDRIVQSELDAAAKNFYRSKEIQRQKQRDAIERMDRERALESQKTQNLYGGIAKVATTGLGLAGKDGIKTAIGAGKQVAGDTATTASGLLHKATGGRFGTAPVMDAQAAVDALPTDPAFAETAVPVSATGLAPTVTEAAMDAGVGNVGSAGVDDLGATLSGVQTSVIDPAISAASGSGPVLPGGGGMMPSMSELTGTGLDAATQAAMDAGVGSGLDVASDTSALDAAMDAGVGNAVGFDAGAELAAESAAEAGGSTLSEALPALGAAVKVGKGLYDVTQARDAHEAVQGVWNMADGVLRYVQPYYGIGRTAANLVNAGLGLAGVDDKALKVTQSVFDPAGALAGEYGNIAAWLGIEDFLDDLI